MQIPMNFRDDDSSSLSLVTLNCTYKKTAIRLRALKPSHELLKYLPLIYCASERDPNCKDPAIRSEFLERFGSPGILNRKDPLSTQDWIMTLWTYDECLQEACEDPEKVIVVTHKKYLGFGP